MQRTSLSWSSVKWRTTVILFCVRVPVLSEQMTCVQPRVSTAESLRMIALCWLIFVTPMDSTMVTTAARPSGMAATASDTATMKVFSTRGTLSKKPMPCFSHVTPNTRAQITMQMTESTLDSSSSFFWSGVSSSVARDSASAIFPISVPMPVATTTARPRPYTTVEPM